MGEFDFGLLDEAEYEGRVLAKEQQSVTRSAQAIEKETVDEAVEKPIQPAKTSDGGGDEEEEEEETTARAVLMAVARHSPQAAIMQGWTEVEMAIHAVRRQSLLRVHRNDVITRLQKLDVLSEPTAAQYVRLRRLRNEAAHAYEGDIGIRSAEIYAKLALQLAEEIRAAGEALAARK